MLEQGQYGEVIERLTAALGRPLLEFMLNASPEKTGDLSPEQISVLKGIDEILTGPVSSKLNAARRKSLVRGITVSPGEDGVSPAIEAHVLCGGTLPEFSAGTSLDNLIGILARDTFPAFLLPPEELPGGIWRGPVQSIFATSALLQHPLAKSLEAAVLADPISRVFGDETPPVGRSTETYRSTMRGGELQLVMVPNAVLTSAWRKMTFEERPSSVEAFCEMAKSQLSFLREALTGKTLMVKARRAFTGVRLPPGTMWDAGGDVLLREATGREHEFAPESLKGRLSGTDASGISTEINYDGDIVVEFDYPYHVKAFPDPIDDSAPVFDDFTSSELVERLTTRLRLSLLIAITREYKVQLAPTWLYIEDPLEDGGEAQSWADSRRSAGLMPTQLTPEDLETWQKWYGLLGSPQADRISVAQSRVLRASGERREPSDVLIDSVIAWENLFGSQEGEPTLRVTTSLALLLEELPQARRSLRTKLAKIYGLRSKVVHGNRALGQGDYALCNEALDYAIQALRVLVAERPDVLARPSSSERSLYLLLNESQS